MGRKNRKRAPASPRSPNTPNSAFASALSNEVLDVTQIRQGRLKKGDRYAIGNYETMTSNDDESDRTPTGSMLESDDDASETASSDGSRSTSYSDTSASAYESDIVQEEDEDADDDTVFLDRRPNESYVAHAPDAFPFIDSWVDRTCGWLDRQTMCVNFVTGDAGKGSSLLRESRLHAHGIQPKRLEGLKTSMILAATEENKRSKRSTRLGLLDMNKEESGDIVITASTDPKHHKAADGKIHKKKQVNSWKNHIRSMRSEESMTSVASGESGPQRRGPRIKLTRTEDRHGVAVIAVTTYASESDDGEVDGEGQGDNSEGEEQELSEEEEGTKATDDNSSRDNAAEDNSDQMQDSPDEQPDENEDGDKQDSKEDANYKRSDSDADSVANSNDVHTGKPLGVRKLGVRTERASLRGGAKSNNSSERASDNSEERKSTRSGRSIRVSITDLTHVSDVELPARPSRANSPVVMEVLEMGGDLTLTPKGRNAPPPTRSPGTAAAHEEDPFVSPFQVEQPELTGLVSNLWEEEEAKLRGVVQQQQQQRGQENQDNVQGDSEASDEDGVDEAVGNRGVSDLASHANMIWAEEEQKVAQRSAINPSDANEHVDDRRPSLGGDESLPRSKSKTDISLNGPSDHIVLDASVRTRDSRYKGQPRPEALENKSQQMRRGSLSAATTRQAEVENADGRRKRSESRDSTGQMVFDSATNLGHRQKALGLSDQPGTLRAEGQEDEHTNHLSRRRARSHDLRGQNVYDEEGQEDMNASRTSRRSRSQDLRGPNAPDDKDDAQIQDFRGGNGAPEEHHLSLHRKGSKSADLRDPTFVGIEDEANISLAVSTRSPLRKSKSGIDDPSIKPTRRFDTPLRAEMKIQDLRNAILDVQQHDIRRVDHSDVTDMSVGDQSMRRSTSRDPRDASFTNTRGQEVPSSPHSRASRVSGGLRSANESSSSSSSSSSYGRVLHETKSREMRRSMYDAPESIAGRLSTHETKLEPTMYDMPDAVVHPSRSRDSRRETNKYEGPDGIVRPSRSRGDLMEAPRGRDLHESFDYPDQMGLVSSKSRGSIREAPSRDTIRDSRSRDQEYSIRTPRSREPRDAIGRNQSHGSEYAVRGAGSRSDLSRRQVDEYGAPSSSSNRGHHRFESQEENEIAGYNGSLRSPSFLGVRQSYDGGAPDLGASSRSSLHVHNNGPELGFRASRSRGEYGAFQSQQAANVQRYDDDRSRTSRASNYDDFGPVEQHVIRPTRSRGMRGEPIDIEDYETRNTAMSSRDSRRISSSSNSPHHLAAAEDEFDRYREERDEKSRGSRKSSSKSITSTSAGSSSRFTEEQLVAAKELRKLEKKLEKQLKHLKRDKDDRSRTSTDLRQIEKQLERKLKREDEKRASRLKRLRKKSQEVVKPGSTSTTSTSTTTSPEVNLVRHYQPSSSSIQERVRVDHEIQTITEKAEELRIQAKEARSRAMGVSSVSPAPGRSTTPSPLRPTTTGFYSSKPNRTRRQQLDHLRSSLRGKEI